MTDTVKDESLLEGAMSGDRDAFLLLYKRYRNPIFRFLYRLLGSAEIAEDIAHDCFLSLIRGFEKSSFPAPASLRTRLYSTARTRALKYLENSGQAAVVKDTLKVDATPRRNRADNQAHEGKLVSEVAEAVASLPPLEREALILSEYEGLRMLISLSFAPECTRVEFDSRPDIICFLGRIYVYRAIWQALTGYRGIKYSLHQRGVTCI